MRVTGFELTPERLGSALDVRRFVNDSIQYVARQADGDPATVFEFLCECGDLRCRREVKLTLAEYEESIAGSLRGY